MAINSDFEALLNRCCEEAYTRLRVPRQVIHDNLL